MAEVTLLYDYTRVIGIRPPKGHRYLVNRRFDDAELRVNIREVSDSAAPIAIVKEGESPIQYRWYKNRLWTSMVCGYSHWTSRGAPGEKQLPPIVSGTTLDLRWLNDYADHDSGDRKEVIARVLRHQMANLLIIDGVTHRSVREPRYLVEEYLEGQRGDRKRTAYLIVAHETMKSYDRVKKLHRFSLLQRDAAFALVETMNGGKGYAVDALKDVPMYRVHIPEAAALNPSSR